MNKAPDAFRTISEVGDDLDLPQHVLRFWETKFNQIKPMKRGGGRRYYRPDDVDLLRGIKHMLYDEGYTIRGLQKILKELGAKHIIDIGRGDISPNEPEKPQPSNVSSARAGEKRDGPVEKEGARSSKQAVSVEELTQPKSGGLLTKLRGKEAAVDASLDNRTLSPEDRRNLQATLYELLECKRLLDQVRGS